MRCLPRWTRSTCSASICFKTGPPRKVGVEVEWLVHDLHPPHHRYPPTGSDASDDAARPAPAIGAHLRARRPAGTQLPARRVPDRVHRLPCRRPRRRARRAARQAWHSPVSATTPGTPRAGCCASRATTPWRPISTATGPAGRAMMRASASVQVCLDAGTGAGPARLRRRWQLAAPAGRGAGAPRSPTRRAPGRPTGWRSTRQAAVGQMDPARTLAPPTATADPRDAWAAHVLDAPVMCVRGGDGPWNVPGRA